MNLALPAAFILLALLPGIVLRSSYLTGRFPRQAFGSSPISELAQYFILAIPPDALFVVLWDWCRGVPPPSTELLIRCLSGTIDATSIGDLASVLSSNSTALLCGYLLLIGGTYLAGSLLRRAVWALRIDVYFRPLRMKPDWYYVLQGRLPSMPRRLLPYADILVTHPEGSRLYRGLVDAIGVRAGGELQELVLTNAHRGKSRGEEFEWVEIPGDQFILLGTTIHSINMRYFAIEPPPGGSGLARSWEQARAYLRSFCFEEP